MHHTQSKPAKRGHTQLTRQLRAVLGPQRCPPKGRRAGHMCKDGTKELAPISPTGCSGWSKDVGTGQRWRQKLPRLWHKDKQPLMRKNVQKGDQASIAQPEQCDKVPLPTATGVSTET